MNAVSENRRATDRLRMGPRSDAGEAARFRLELLNFTILLAEGN